MVEYQTVFWAGWDMGGADQPAYADNAVTVTRLLNEAGAGDPQAATALLPLVYEQLRRLAKRKMQEERPGQTLQATALVHEAYLRLVDNRDERRWDGRWHFFAAAAEAMRRILVDSARRRTARKRGGGRDRVSLQNAAELTLDAPPDDLLALDEALAALAVEQPRKEQLVKLRYFAGLTNEQAAQAMGISVSTAERHWSYARAWLHRRMNGPTSRA